MLLAVSALGAVLLAVLIGGEAIHIGALAGPEKAADYHFGTESMVSHGGWAYESRGSFPRFGADADCVLGRGWRSTHSLFDPVAAVANVIDPRYHPSHGRSPDPGTARVQ